MLRRGYPSRWVYREFRDEGAPITANFKIQLNDDAGFTSPYALLYSLIDCADPSDTRTFYDEWVS